MVVFEGVAHHHHHQQPERIACRKSSDPPRRVRAASKPQGQPLSSQQEEAIPTRPAAPLRMRPCIATARAAEKPARTLAVQPPPTQDTALLCRGGCPSPTSSCSSLSEAGGFVDDCPLPMPTSDFDDLGTRNDVETTPQRKIVRRYGVVEPPVLADLSTAPSSFLQAGSLVVRATAE